MPLDEEHLDSVLEIEREAYPEPWSVGMFRQEISSASSYFYAMSLDGDLIGYGGFWLILDEAHITSVTVAATHRRRGLGDLLVRYMLDKAVEAGARRATLEVRPTNKAARILYSRLGFVVSGRRKRYYAKTNEDAIIMMKELRSHEQA